MRSASIGSSFLVLTSSLVLASCSGLSSSKQPLIYAAGDKATVGPLIYTLTDAQTAEQLGDDPNSARTPRNRFYLIRVNVSNSGNDDQSIPAMTLVDESGETYNEIADGTGVANWLGVVRKVSAAQTEQGYVVFDAPIKHYRLRLNDPLDGREIAIDVPVTFVRERGSGLLPAPASAAPTAEVPIPKKN